MKKWKTKKSVIILDDKFMRVKKDLVELPTDKAIQWTYWDSIDSVMVLGMTKDNKLVMVRQYKYLVQNEVMEFPAGSLRENEQIEDGARREFEEETGYKCNSIIKLGSFYETYSQLNRQIHIYFANNVIKSKINPDRGDRGFEEFKIELVDFEKAVELARKNKIAAMGCSLAVLLLKEKVNKDEIKL